jgi:hypothetical protein
VHISCHETADHVVEQIPTLAQAILDIVTKDPQRPHVADQMQPAAMEKHRGEHRYETSRQVPGLDVRDMKIYGWHKAMD